MKRFLLLFFIPLFGGCRQTVEVKCKDEMCLSIVKHHDSQLNSFSYIINGKYNSHSLPSKDFAVVRNYGNSDWSLMAQWHGDSLLLYQPYGYIQIKKSVLGRIKVVKIPDTVFFEIFDSSRPDSLLYLTKEP
ncbi:hypothetical protein [Parachryseolinea silvisoli]|uniref:hypothetical protein n=1 Tax=Parachryseolinea silvisoli TaxID=2873601 RepID=UPI002265AADC|nr:hypothetical protein [Parachryseolinea silvisoli]MCD9020186.1 hypothetical protein [Parachryseolinea silvisoli]